MRAFFVTIATYQKKCLLQKQQNAELFLDVLRHYEADSQFTIHAFVIMPDHVHIVLSPAKAGTIEKSVQFIKGGFSFRLKKELGFPGEVWQQRFHDHRLRDESEFFAAVEYTHQNPVRRGLCRRPEDFLFSSANPFRRDARPQRLKPSVSLA
jgi:putative transposase